MNAQRKRIKGAAILEFAFASLLLIPVMLGSFELGMGVTRYLRVSSVCRSTGSMFVRGADFSEPVMKSVLLRISTGLGLGNLDNSDIDPNGKMLIIVTQLMRVGDEQCSGLPSGQTCTNRRKVVIVKQLKLGNTSLRQSGFGTPTGGSPDAHGAYSSTFYLTDSRASVALFGTAGSDTDATAGAPVDLRAGELAYVAEAYMSATGVRMMPDFINLPGYYTRTYF